MLNEMKSRKSGKIQYCSDLHLEFPENKNFLKEHPIESIGEVLLLAGDVIPFALMDKHKDFFSYVSDNFQTTYWIPGNHEYYHSDVSKRSGTMNENIRSNVHLVNNVTIEKDNIRFIFSTLWSKINSDKQLYFEKELSDFHAIKYKDYRFSINRYNELHQECLRFVTSELQERYTGKTIAITHHVPTLFNYPAQYKDSDLNEAFAIELFDLIEANGPDYWIYGHHHVNTPEFKIEKTQMFTNQLGYVKYGEQKGFKTNAIIKI
jgi:predicted phosphohydrolase